MAIHVSDVIRHEMVQNFDPTTCVREHPDTPMDRLVKLQEEAVRQLAIGIVFGQNQYVGLILIDQSWPHVIAEQGPDKIAADVHFVEGPHQRGLEMIVSV